MLCQVDAFKRRIVQTMCNLLIKADLLYEFDELFLEQFVKQLCLMTIASWYHSFPSRTGQ